MQQSDGRDGGRIPFLNNLAKLVSRSRSFRGLLLFATASNHFLELGCEFEEWQDGELFSSTEEKDDAFTL